MSKFRFLVISMTVMIAAAMTPAAVAQQATQNVQQLERDIEMHEKNIKQNEDSIKSLEDRIENLKSQVKELESQKKALEKDVKNETKMRRDKFTLRDELVYDEEIADVLYNPYNKGDVDEALDSFEGMETKEVIKKKELVEKYGEYTKDLKDFMEKMKNQLTANKWKYLSSTSDLYKKFEKELKGTKYWKIYNKKEKNESIDYLDRIVDKIMLFKNEGLKNESQFNQILNMLYAN
jgi:cell division protein FtsB